jgi:signal transduction histidine kinase
MIDAKILAVDDLEDTLLGLADLLRQKDLEVLTARCGEEALAILEANDVALALIDVVLPEMDGFELAERMRASERTRTVPLIFISGAIGDAQRVFHGYDLGAVDFIHKPIDARIVKHKVDVFIELYRQKKALADTLRLSEELLAIVSHDLRNPLNAILMSADLLERRRSDDDVLKAARRVQRSGARMVRMLDDLVDLTRARLSGGIPIEREAVDLEAIARKVTSELGTDAAPRVRIDVSGDTSVKADAIRLEQIVGNLLGNALKHGAPDGAVSLTIAGEADRVRLSVHNRGAMPLDVLREVFEPFRSRSSQRARPDGLGLGLYIVGQIAAAHGGTAHVASSDADGTTADVILPRAP